ncbi:MAG: hypothetical protein HFH29_07930 [Eubacterium sp.]|nr:hypothetical protein [Eubacterium sp.]
MKKRKYTLKDYRIFLGTQEIAGVMLRLHNAFDDLGITNSYYCVPEYVYGTAEGGEYKNEELRHYDRHTEHVKKMYWANHRIRFRLWQLVQMFDVLWIFIKALFRYNAFIYIFGRGLFFRNFYLSHIQFLEYWILRLFHKRVVIWCCGDDTRPPYCGSFDGDSKALKTVTKQKAKIVRMQEKYAVMIDFPASSHFHKRPYINYTSIGVPIDQNEIAGKKDKNKEKVVIFHAPSDQKWKGTQTIRKVIAHIKSLGFPVEYVEVTGVSHETVIEMIAESDIVVDQMFSDTPMAGFAAEAAANGIPVVVAGYYADYYKTQFCRPIPPTCFCRPDQLERMLISLIQDQQERIKVGALEKKFVMENWMSHDVAKRMLSLIDGTYPKEWLYDPKQNAYIWGAGNRKRWVAEKVVDLADHYGMKALCLPKQSILYQKYLKLYKKQKDLRKSRK